MKGHITLVIAAVMIMVGIGCLAGTTPYEACITQGTGSTSMNCTGAAWLCNGECAYIVNTCNLCMGPASGTCTYPGVGTCSTTKWSAPCTGATCGTCGTFTPGTPVMHTQGC